MAHFLLHVKDGGLKWCSLVKLATFSKEADTVWQFVFGSVSNFSSTVEVFHASLIVVVVH